jgi:pimeloyl-ACP methyl ester carboxylesterase
VRRAEVVHDGVKLAVRDYGGAGRDLLLLHGLSSTSHIFDLMAPDLTAQFHVVAYDQRGHGQSGKPSGAYGFDEVAGDGAAVIGALGLRRPVALGHSWGANVALEIGARHPGLVSGLILLDGGFMAMRDRMEWETAKETLAPPPLSGLRLDEYLSMVRGFMGEQLQITPQVERVFRSLMRVDRDGRIHPRLSRANHLRILRAMWEEDPLARLRGIGVPTLVVGTRRRDAEGPEAMFIASKELGEQEVRKIGGLVRFRWIEGIHDVPLQHPEAVVELVREFSADAPL